MDDIDKFVCRLESVWKSLEDMAKIVIFLLA